MLIDRGQNRVLSGPPKLRFDSLSGPGVAVSAKSRIGRRTVTCCDDYRTTRIIIDKWSEADINRSDLPSMSLRIGKREADHYGTREIYGKQTTWSRSPRFPPYLCAAFILRRKTHQRSSRIISSPQRNEFDQRRMPTFRARVKSTPTSKETAAPSVRVSSMLVRSSTKHPCLAVFRTFSPIVQPWGSAVSTGACVA